MIWQNFLRNQLFRTLYDAPRRFAVMTSYDYQSQPEFRVSHVGRVTLPLQQVQLSSLSAVSEQLELAPGSHFHDKHPTISRLQIDAENVQFSIDDRSFISSLARELVTGLDVSPFCLCTKLDKLVIHGKHGYSEPYKQTEAELGTFATVILQLPALYRGGQLQVCHDGQTMTFDMSDQSHCKVYCAMFFNHCHHERLPVTSGYCLSLVYRVSHRAPGPLPSMSNRCSVSYMLREAAALWEAMPRKSRPKLFAIPLEHNYRLNEFSFTNLQGLDAKRADQIKATGKYSMFLIMTEKRERGYVPKNPGARYFYESPHDEDAVQNRDTFNPVHAMKEVQEQHFEVIKFVKENGREVKLKDLWEAGEEPISEMDFLNKQGLFENSKPHAESYDAFVRRRVAPLQFSYRAAALIFWPQAFHVDFFCSKGFSTGVKYVVQAYENRDADARRLLRQIVDYGKDNLLDDNDGALMLLNFACTIKDVTLARHALDFMLHVKKDHTIEAVLPMLQSEEGCSSSDHCSSFLKAIRTFDWEPIREATLNAIRVTPSDLFDYCFSLVHSMSKENYPAKAKNDIKRAVALAIPSKSLADSNLPDAADVLFSLPCLTTEQRKFMRQLRDRSVESMALLLESLHVMILEDGIDCGAAKAFAHIVPMFIRKEFDSSRRASRSGFKDMLRSYVSMYGLADPENIKNLRYSRSSALVFSLLVDNRTMDVNLLKQFIYAALASRRRKLLSILVQLIPSETPTNPSVNEILNALRTFNVSTLRE